MGTDIDGWVEVKSTTGNWRGVIKIQPLLDRHYDMFSCLFGVKNYAGFVPVVEERGMPVDSSYQARFDHWHLVSHSHTWIMWEEILNINWDEPAERLDRRVRHYRRNEDGEWQLYMKSLKPSFARFKFDKEEFFQDGDTLFKVERMTRGDALTSQWKFLFKFMETLGDRFGNGNVRLIVWFDS